MSRNKNRRKPATTAPSPFEQARDELFQHIMRCGVIQAAAQDQQEWFNDTMDYLSDRYHELTDAQIAELRTLGTRFCQPPKAKAPEQSESGAASAA
jgi:hypothetical protein